MGGCFTSNNKDSKRKSQSARPINNKNAKTRNQDLDHDDHDKLIHTRGSTVSGAHRTTHSEAQYSLTHPIDGNNNKLMKRTLLTSQNQMTKQDSDGQQPNFKSKQDRLPKVGARDQTPEPGDIEPSPKGKSKNIKPANQMFFKQKGFNLSPAIRRHFRIYNISSKAPVVSPYSRDLEWQQILSLYNQKLNMASFQQNIGGQNITAFKNKRPIELMNHLEQITMHREIELMVKILNLRNRNWVQEQIKMSRRLASMQPGSFDSLVVTREYLQLKEHFHWHVWAVSYYYFYLNQIEQFFQHFSNIAKQEAGNMQSSRAKQQNMIHQEINHLFNQLKNLKIRLPSPISKKWTEGHAFQGVFFRMLPLSDSAYVKNEMKALKYIQTELIELNSIQNQLQEQNPRLTKKPSIYNNLLLPLLSSIECGGFIIFASPVIYIPEYQDNSGDQFFEPIGSARAGNYSTSQYITADQSRFRERSLTMIYGQNVYLNQKHINKNSQNGVEDNYQFLQDNIGEINDDMLNMMPLLKNLTNQNMIPIMDFEDHTQSELNFLILHAYECIPSISTKMHVAMVIPQDQGEPIKYVQVQDISNVSLNQIQKFTQRESIVRDPIPMKLVGVHHNKESVVNDNDSSDFEEQDYTKPDKLKETFSGKSFSKHGCDLMILSSSSSSIKINFANRDGNIMDNQGLANKRAQLIYQSREQEFQFAGLIQTGESELVFSMSQVALAKKNAEKQQAPEASGQAFKKHSILRKNVGDNFHTHQYGLTMQTIYQNDLNNEDQSICGNAFAVADNNPSSFKLKYSMINHKYSFPIEQIFMDSVINIAKIIENTDTICNVQSLKELFSRKGLNLRFQWLLLTKLKSNFHRELTMIHILVRIIKKIVNEEVKLKSQVFTPAKSKIVQPKTLADHQKQTVQKQQPDIPTDHFMGNQQDTFKDNIVFITNTLLRRKFSKQKHVFDETLIGLFLNRLKIIPIVQEMISYQQNTGQQLLTENECHYLQSKQILDDIIGSASQNPALYLNTIQRYFQVDIEGEFLRKSRQDKYLFLSQLTSQPMVLNNILRVNLNVNCYFTIKEHCFLMLANEIYKQHQINSNQIMQQQNQIGQNQNLRNNIFRNQHSAKRRAVDLVNLPSQFSLTSQRDFQVNHNQKGSINNKFNQQQDNILNNSMQTDKGGIDFLTGQSSQMTQTNQNRKVSNLAMKLEVNETPRQFNNIEKELNAQQLQLNNQDSGKSNLAFSNPQAGFPEMIIPSILYKIKTQDSSSEGSSTPFTNLLPYYKLPNKDLFNKWVMYLESILKEVYSIDGTESILLEALNYLAITIYFSQQNEQFSNNSSMSPPGMSRRESMSSARHMGGPGDIIGNFDLDQFTNVCTKIKDLQAVTSNCAPEVLIMSQLICGLNFEQFQDDQTFPIESEKSYLTAMICMFHLIGDPRGRGNLSLPLMLLSTWKLGILSLCTENRKIHDSEFSEELFDAVLHNLTNHKQMFRVHQNEKLKRVEFQTQLDAQLKQQNGMAGKHKNNNSVFSHRKPHVDGNQIQNQYSIDQFEIKMDNSVKSKSLFSIDDYGHDPTKIFQEHIGDEKNQIPSINVNKSMQTSAGGFGKKNIGNQKNPNSYEQFIEQQANTAKKPSRLSHLQAQLPDTSNKDIIGEANINDINLDFGENKVDEDSVFIQVNNPEAYQVPEVPFFHWSIQRQGIQNFLTTKGHKFIKNQKQTNKLLSQLFKNALETAIDKIVLFNWMVKYNLIMYQSGIIWKNNQIKQAVFFQSAQMISSKSSSKSFRQNDSEYSLSMSMQGSVISQNGNKSFRMTGKTQHLGTYSSIINTENGSINKSDLHGVVYSWGSDAQGQLGLDAYAHLTKKPVTQKVLYPRVLTSLKDEFIKEVCCGYQHTLVITINGNVYSWGANESKQLGLGPISPEFVRKPCMIITLKNVVKVAAGNEHSVAINKNHELYSWGLSTQTGQNDTLNRDTPTKIEYFKNTKIMQVACGGLHTLAITKENKVFCWGSTEGGQLGLPINLIQKLCKTEENAVKFPQQIVSLQDQTVTQIACGETHSIALCKNGILFGWGMSLYGQLGLGFSADSFEPGLGMEKSKVMEPKKIDSLNGENVSRIFCGSTFSLFLTDKGELYGCGMNDLGQLGEDIFNDFSVLESAKMGQIQTSDITIPTQVSSLQGITINTLACGEAHVLAIDGDGDKKNMLWAWGSYKNGQLGLGEVNVKMNPRPVQNLAAGTINKVACGSAHSIALIGDASNVTTLSPNYYAANEVLTNQWSTQLPKSQ